MTTHIVLWKWKGKSDVDRIYTFGHVNTLARAIWKNAPDVRIICVTDNAKGIERVEAFPLWADCDDLKNATKSNLPSCYRRLKLYDPETQKEMGIKRGDRIVSLDLDTVVTGPLSAVLDTEGLYVGWRLPGGEHEWVYNGSFQMFSAGTLEDVWKDFDPERSPAEALKNKFRGSDQAWLSMKLIKRAGVTHIPYPTLASYPLHVRKIGTFSAHTRLVFFHGAKKPWQIETMRTSPWIKRYWRTEDDLQVQ